MRGKLLHDKLSFRSDAVPALIRERSLSKITSETSHSQAMQSLKQLARQLKKETYTLYLASKHPKVPWHARLLAALVVAYAFSPIDLIPDAIPILGYLDDLILVPGGIWLVVKMIPPEILAECREKAAEAEGKPTNWVAAGVIVAIWVILGILAVLWIGRIFKS